MTEMPTSRSGGSASSRGWLRGSTLVSAAGAGRLVHVILERKSVAVAGALIVSAALTVFRTAADRERKKSKIAVRQDDGMFVMDDFESGALSDWQAAGAGAGGWFIYSDGQNA